MANNERLGASFSIDVSNLKAGLKTANSLIRESQSEFKKAAAGLDDWTKSEEGLNAKIKSLNSIVGVQEKKVEALKKEYQRLVDDGLDETSDRAIYLRTQINKEEAALESNKQELEKQKKALEDVENASEETGDSFDDVGRQAESTSGSFTVMKGALANLVADGFRMAINAAKDFAKEMVTVGMSFDDSMAQVAAVSGASGEELDRLRAKAKEMGESTKFTASEAADAFNYMAMAGWKTEDMISGIDGILNLAAASGSDLATTSDIVTDALTAMGYEAKDAGRLADVMAAASSNANTNVEMMGQTFQYAAPIVGALGYSMEDTAVQIGLMANAGIKGEKAGTALRSILTRLSAPPAECADAMETLGISITKTDGTMKSLDEVMGDMRTAFSKLSETEQTAMAKHIAGQEAMSGLLAIVNAAPADFQKLQKAVENSTGAAEDMADTMLDTLGGDMTVLNSQIEGVKITLYEEFEPTLRKVIKSVQKWLSSVNWKDFGKKAADALKKIIDFGKQLAKAILPPLKKALGFVIDNFKTLAIVVGTAITVFKTFKAVMAIKALITAVTGAIAGLSTGVGIATKAQTVWNAALSANPIGAVITAVALLTAGIALLIPQLNKNVESQKFLNEEQRKAVEVAEEQKKAYDDTKQAAAEAAQQDLTNIDYTQKLWAELQTLATENGEVKAGYEDRANYILNELNNALGTEYKMNGNVIQSYKDIAGSIDDVIQKKKAQILLEAYEESYREAIENTANAEQARVNQAHAVVAAEQTLEETKKKLKEAEDNYNQAILDNDGQQRQIESGKIAGYKHRVEQLELALDEEKQKYNESTLAVQGYYQDIATYEQASTAALQGKTEEAIGLLSRYQDGFKTAANTAQLSADDQIKTLKQQVIDTEVNLQLMEKDYEESSANMTEEEKRQAQQRIENARQQAHDAKVEFQKVGGNMAKGMAIGAEDEGWALPKAIQNIINKAVAAAEKAADIHSPSKLFEDKIGKMIGLGIAKGIDDSTAGVLTAVRTQVKDIEQAYNVNGYSASLGAGMEVHNANASMGTHRNVTVNQYNTYSQAHSRYEIYKSKQETAAAVRLALRTV